MTFDPFGDLETRGYLRNLAGEKNAAIVRRLEHASFTTGLDDAFKSLAAKKRLTCADVLRTHKTLFEAVYPWAGQDRATTSPDIAVSRVDVAQRHDGDDAGHDEETAGHQAAGRAMQQPADVSRKLLCLGAGEQHAIVQRVQETTLGDPVLFLDDDAMHHRDLSRRAAE